MVIVSVAGRSVSCDVATTRCDAAIEDRGGARWPRRWWRRAGGRGGAPPVTLSPDGKRAAFIRDWNLWVRDVATGHETQLTTDGVKDFGYATDNAGWTQQRSRDSALVARLEEDRHVPAGSSATSARCTSSSTQVGHPELQAWKYPLPGDSVVAMIQRVVIDVDERRR